MHTSSHTVLYDPDGLIEAELPLDREPYESLVVAVVAWTGEGTPATRDFEQIGLQLTGHARAVASAVRRRANQLPKNSGARALADVVLREPEDGPREPAPPYRRRDGPVGEATVATAGESPPCQAATPPRVPQHRPPRKAPPKAPKLPLSSGRPPNCPRKLQDPARSNRSDGIS